MSEDKTQPDERPKTVRFHYLKSPWFHTVHADGVIGGITPRANIHMAFYAERLPIPTQTEHGLTADGALGDEVRELRICRDGVLRELEVDVIMNLASAESLHKWLGFHIKSLQERMEEDGGAEAAKEPVKGA